MSVNLANIWNRLQQSRQGTWLKDSYLDLAAKGPGYWILAGFMLVIGLLLGEMLGHQGLWVNVRYSIYKKLQDASAHSLRSSTRTVVVLIGDDEFWKGPLARRIPVKRDYLACLLLKLAEANPAALGVDLDLGSQTADKSFVDHPDYRVETHELLEAIKTIAAKRPVVLPRSLYLKGVSISAETTPAGDDEGYESEPTVFASEFKGTNILQGYVSLPRDVRKVALTMRLKDGTDQDSFAAAAVRNVDESALLDAESPDKSLPYGTFLEPHCFKPISANQVFATSQSELEKRIAHKVVLIGGSWHSISFGRGKQIDMHASPVGEIEGVFIHANYIEALLMHRASPPISKTSGLLIEILLTAFMAIVFAWQTSPLRKFAWALGLSAMLVVLTYIFWQNLGLFFDFFIPLILLGGHAFVAQVIEWREQAHPSAVA